MQAAVKCFSMTASKKWNLQFRNFSVHSVIPKKQPPSSEAVVSVLKQRRPEIEFDKISKIFFPQKMALKTSARSAKLTIVNFFYKKNIVAKVLTRMAASVLKHLKTRPTTCLHVYG